MSESLLADRCCLQSGDLVDEKFLVQKTLGEGSFGVVYLVSDIYQKQQYAMKLLRLWEVPADIRQPLKERFKMEFDTGQIACDNLVQSLSYGSIKGNPYIIMEYCPGGDLNPKLGKSDCNVSKICQDVLIGLNALHIRGKVHRDLKPENILFKQNGIAALTDFGIVGDRNHRLTQRNIFDKPQQIFGTYAYMPPEQAGRARGGATVLPTTDIFSFGVLTFQMLSGKLPFGPLESHNDLSEYLQRGKEGNWDRDTLRFTQNGKQWSDLIDACLRPDFRERLQTANEVLRHLPHNEHVKPAKPYDLLSSYNPVQHSSGYQLRVLNGEEHGRIYDLSRFVGQGRHLFTVGRTNNNCICIKSDYSDFMSRKHCTIETTRNGQTWMIRDGQWEPSELKWKESRNGTFVNVRPVSPKGFYLQPGDIITMGDVTLRFENY